MIPIMAYVLILHFIAAGNTYPGSTVKTDALDHIEFATLDACHAARDWAQSLRGQLVQAECFPTGTGTVRPIDDEDVK